MKKEVKRLHLTRKAVCPIIDECHELYGHFVPLKCMRMLSETFHYPRFVNVIRKRIASCKSWQLKAQRYIIHQFLLTSTCCTLRNATTKAALLKLSNDYFPKYGKPERIICDNGS